MSRQTELLEIDKCIVSRLWYTSLIVYQENSDRFPKDQDTVDFPESEALIKSLVHCQNEDQHYWITHVLLSKLLGNIATNVRHNVERQKDRVEMAEALQLCANVPIKMQQCLLLLYEIHSKQEAAMVLEKIYEECLLFLKKNATDYPNVTCWIVNELYSYLKEVPGTVRFFQDLYVNIVKELLERVSLSRTVESESTEWKETADKNFGALLCTLSRMNVIDNMDNHFSTWLYPALLRISDIKDVELALYCRNDRRLFYDWCSFLDKVYLSNKTPDTLESALKIREVMFHFKNDGNTVLNRNELLRRLSKTKSHWITDILDTCYILTMNGKYDEVSSILSCDLLRNFWPVLLLKVLNDCPSERIGSVDKREDSASTYNAIKYLIHKCDFNTTQDSALRELNDTFKKHIKIVECVLNWKRSTSTEDSCEAEEKFTPIVVGEQIVSIKHILSLLQNFNTLSVLKAITNLHEQEYDRIQNLLTELGESENVFQAYYCILSAFKAILLCESYNTRHKQIAVHLSDMKYRLQTLYPLSLRLKVIENVFSLLFLRYEDFNLDQSNSDEDNVSTSDEVSRFESKPTEQCLTGFICNKYVIRDMLIYLKDSVLTAGIDLAKWKKKVGFTEEIDSIQKNISSVNAAIINARWRLELYTSPRFLDNLGEPDDTQHSFGITNKSEVLWNGKINIPNRLKEQSFFYYDSTSDDTKIKSDSSSESGHMHNGIKWRRRSRHTSLTVDSPTTKDVGHKPFFVNFMLASKESLVTQCLWKSDYTKAQEIIEMSDMKNTELNSEVRFSKALHTFKQNIRKHVHTSKDQNHLAENPQSSTLENIRLAAQDGIQASRHTSQLETFLASQEAHMRMLNTDILNGNEILTLCVLDLALTASHVCAISNNLCDVAMKYLKLCKTFDNTEYSHFFFKIYQLLYENKDELTVSSILCDAKIPLSLKECKEKTEFWSEVTIKYREFKESQTNVDKINEILKENSYLPGLKILGRLIAICSDNEKYLQNICSHLQLLHSIIPTDHVIQTVSDLLKVPLHYYFGYQIFDLNVEPHKLDTIAHNLEVNLVYSILINACPKVPCEKNVKYTVKSKDNGCVVLNNNFYKPECNYVTQGPNQCVSEILSELLQVIRDINLDQSIVDQATCKSLFDHSDVKAVLNKTCRLANLDLSELSVGDETLTFFLNTWNIMFLHASLEVWSNDPPSNNLWNTVSLMSVGYMIGDLGLVTLAALRSKLFENSDADCKFFAQVEELNEPAWQDLDIVNDPRVMFAMANEFYGTPRIRVYDAKTLNEDLTYAFNEYLDYYSSGCLEKIRQNSDEQETILLPHLVGKYEDFLARSVSSGDDTNSEIPLSVETYFKKLEKDVTVEYLQPCYSYDIILKYTGVPQTCRVKTVDQHKALWKTRSLRSSLLQYLECHCWVLSYLLQRIHNEYPTILENYSDNLKRIACLENLLCSTWVFEAKSLFDDNQTLAAIHDSVPLQKLWSYFEVLLEKDKWHECLELINALPDNVLTTNVEMQCFKDKILSQIVSTKEATQSTEMLQYLYQIKDVHVLAQTVLYNVNKWHVQVCEYALLHALHHMDNYKLPVHCKLRMKETLHRMLIFHKMLPYCVGNSNGTWYDVAYCTDKIDPFQIMKSLISADKFELCLEWLECQAFSLDIQSSVTQDFLIGLLKNESQNFKQASKLIQALPLNQAVKMCKGVLKKLEDRDALQFVANYLLEHCKPTEAIKYKRTLVGIDILRMLENAERPLYIHLIKEPLLMLEQLLMNCKFETIQKILNKVSDKLEEVDIPISSFDTIIRFYAQRSLDFRVCLQRDGMESKNKSVQLSTTENENVEFIMPHKVPTKEEWIPNDKARKCSCCKTVIFSMFNRRHHCRRCGRVICAVCSQHRMQVSGYPPSVPVRVCDDCKRQTVLQIRAAQGTPSTPSSEMFDYWRLTRDETHNQTIREEFSFEYAPNISLCLAILNLHTDHNAYTRFLFDRCDEMKSLLQPVSGGKINPEVDHAVIIKMIRSLLVAAKVKCAKLGLNTGLAHCDRFLSQVDFIAILVQSDCLDLIPSDDLDDHTLRKLRDLLIEKEQWTLALDVSTKAGLDTQGVWASWGKTRLKMEYFAEAREKFFHCLDKIVHEDFEGWVVLSYAKESMPDKKQAPETTDGAKKRIEDKSDTGSLKRSEFLKNRPLKDPPLLTEILQILDNLRIQRQYAPFTYPWKSTNVYEVMHGNAMFTDQAQFTAKHTSTQTVYYQESLYYLLTYGSYNSILEFFLKNEEYDKCLAFALDNDLEPELFFNVIYLYCLKIGTTDKLHEAMKNKDSSLLTWRKYLICVCHNLERRQYLNILYQLQLFMKDCVRAAMTCIRFYTVEANDYTHLCSRSHLLLDAQKHLESELQIETLSRKRRKSTTSLHSGQGILTMELEPLEVDRHISTISRQMEIAKFLGNSEKEGRAPVQFLSLFPGMDYDESHVPELPTLFGNQQQKIHLAVLAILCGRDIEEGFGIAFRIMQDYNLPQQKVYSLAGHVLAIKNNIPAIEQLIKCCHTSGTPNSYVIADYVLTHCVKLLLNRLYSQQDQVSKNHIDSLVKLITDIELKINAYIECKQLKAAYLLAVKHSRTQDIRKILKEADRLGQNAIKAICLKWLQQEPK